MDPRYDNDGNDAALVHLADPAAVSPIGLSDDPAPFGLAAVAGWGVTTSSRPRAISDDLRAVQIPVVANRACRRRYGRDFSAATMLCAGGDGRDSCNGDSGGPLVGADGREIGIVSFGGRRCGARRVPAVYTRVAAELPWISGVVARWG